MELKYTNPNGCNASICNLQPMVLFLSKNIEIYGEHFCNTKIPKKQGILEVEAHSDSEDGVQFQPGISSLSINPSQFFWSEDGVQFQPGISSSSVARL